MRHVGLNATQFDHSTAGITDEEVGPNAEGELLD